MLCIHFIEGVRYRPHRPGESFFLFCECFHRSELVPVSGAEYLKATIHEGMRLYPAAWMTERVAIEDDQVGNFSFPAKTIIIPFFFGLHRDKDIWEAPLVFKPQRFITDPKMARSKYFFPFGAGSRMCIGNNFAMIEMSFFLYTFLREFQIRPTGQLPKMKALITLKPDKVILTIQRNNH